MPTRICDDCGHRSGTARSTRKEKLGFDGLLCHVCQFFKVPEFFYEFAQVLVRI